MRLRLLTMSLVDRVLYALNLKTAKHGVEERDARRVAILGSDAVIHEQTECSRAFAEEVSARIAES